MLHKRHVISFVLFLVAYMACVLVSSHFLASMAPGIAKTLVALVPVPAMIGMAWAVVQQLRSLDEMVRRIQLEALGLAFVATALLTFSYGFLETAGFPRLSMFMVWSLMGPLWALGTFIGVRRYR
ncbi:MULTISPECIES: hypothetical protein [Pseudomonas]|uniref:Uncharacterized protein n=2 Tax=Pseudomonas TaxID=286 RepID=A0AAD0LA31_PSEPU|nr:MULTISPECIES: hypothetical protein [Pseudomonas]AXA25465.1 hypothetical protein C1S65_15560 [Pseudomonas putida]KAB5625838.1 hypothetical protein F7234_08630 [Pseudomonas putida]MEA5673370.1 hypothetical protein [Pseudomonas sp. MH2]OCT29568.1 hypothetical protein A6E20_03900 [Pseudomonas putida]OCT31264.1 hypothetical protein A6E23_01655 [Pseudomonas putida]